MKNADDWVRDAMQHLESGWHTHYHSEMVDALEAAVTAFDQALALQPDRFDALYEKGMALMRLERYEQAAAALAEAQRWRPEVAELRRQLEECSRRLGRQRPAPGPKATGSPRTRS